jgi:hypothetical protein
MEAGDGLLPSLTVLSARKYLLVFHSKGEWNQNGYGRYSRKDISYAFRESNPTFQPVDIGNDL